MKKGEIYGGNYLKADDLNGKPAVVVTISDVSVAELGDGQKKAVLHFTGAEKALLLNVTNANMVEELCGSDEMDEWVGHRICLFTTKVDFQGKRVNAIRIKEAPAAGTLRPKVAKPAVALEPVNELTDDEIPF